jgi:glucokinase
VLDGIAGVDLGGTRIKIGLADTTGHIISTSILETRGCRDAEGIVEKISTTVKDLAFAASVHVIAAGVGCPGRIDHQAGRVVWLKSKLEFLEGAPLGALLDERLGCPVACDNDVNAMLAGEMRFGAGRGYQNVVAIAVGTGIGGALFLEGRLVRGHNWAAGHFGFMSHDPAGPRHACGNSGIVEEHASQSGVLRRLREASDAGEKSRLTQALAEGDEPGFCELFAAFNANDPLAARLVKRLTAELGVLIANLIFALDPEIVLVGGGILNCWPGLVDAVRSEAAGRLDYLPENATGILPMTLGDGAGILGGVALAMEFLSKENRAYLPQGVTKK